ncbi:MAG TPA: MBL fold metallo-hydrolase [Gemmatimonas sp.]|uniref:MBL fold metallo-hydrolase n=1 Tax=Gemmatimonas sp. TaxID=1962908 RepID=UPI002EDAAE3F
MPRYWGLLCVLLLWLGGCHWLRTGRPETFAPVATHAVKAVGDCAPRCTDSLDIVAMGVGGYLMVPWRDTTQLLMTPPSFTNPTLWWMALGDWWLGSAPDQQRTARRLAAMPSAGTARLSRVRAVLVGHGHYDHLMDLPTLAPQLTNATVYGSSTVGHLLAPLASTAPWRVAAIDSVAGTDAEHPGQAIVVAPHLRVRAIAWDHAPNIGNLVIANDHERAPRTSLPRSVHGWKLGRVHAYAIDIGVRTDSVDVRLFVHDAAGSPDVVRRAASVLRTMPAARRTIVIIAAANFDQAHAYPDILLAHLAPDHVIFGHWEDFFRSPEKPPRIVRGIRGTELVQIVERYQGKRWTALSPGATLRVKF